MFKTGETLGVTFHRNYHIGRTRTIEDLVKRKGSARSSLEAARAEEVEHAIEEGIRFHFLTNPTRILVGDDHLRPCRWTMDVAMSAEGQPAQQAAPRRASLLLAGASHTTEGA